MLLTMFRSNPYFVFEYQCMSFVSFPSDPLFLPMKNQKELFQGYFFIIQYSQVSFQSTDWRVEFS